MERTIQQILNELAQLANPSVLKRLKNQGEMQPHFGVMMGKVNQIAKKYKQHAALAFELWQTGYLEAQLIAIQWFDPKTLTREAIEDLVNEVLSLTVLDKLVDNVISKSPYIWECIEEWKSSTMMRQRFSWRLMVKLVHQKQLDVTQIDGILQQIYTEMAHQEELIRWVMNQCLVEIAVNYPNYRTHCIAIAEELGVYREMKVAKGCTSAYAPEWIEALLKR